MIDLLDIPTEAEFEEQRDAIKEAKYRDFYVQWYNKAKELARTEAAIHHYASVKELGWQPDSYLYPQKKTEDGKLKGSYHVKVQIPGTEELLAVPVSLHWVHLNFTMKVLATAQKAFLDCYTPQPLKNDKGEAVGSTMALSVLRMTTSFRRQKMVLRSTCSS